MDKITNIKTNLITGFLGSGKTSAVLHLMSQKPKGEKWAVLVNEFGSIGIDGAIYKAKGIEVKEIPGGCMCCAAGVPMRVAINNLIKEVRPQRLLIEASGLGHPKRVLDTLRSEHFKEALTLQASICLIDPRNLLDARYTTHEIFIDQIAIADILVANKIDQCDADTLKNFEQYAAKLYPKKARLIKTSFGKIDAQVLNIQQDSERKAQKPDLHKFTPHKIRSISTSESSASPQKPKDGYDTVSVTLNKNLIFDSKKLSKLFTSLEAERIKAVMRTDKGWMIFNIHKENTETIAADSTKESRIEIISAHLHSEKPRDAITIKKLAMNCISDTNN